MRAIYLPARAGGTLRGAVVLSPPRLRAIEHLGWLTTALSQAGYAVLGHRYRDGKSRYQLRDVDDIRNAVTWVHSRVELQGLPIVAIGHSRGGNATLRAAALDKRIVASVAFGAPTDVSGYVRGLRDYAPSRYRLMVNGYGATPEEDPQYYESISPLHYAARLGTPVLLVHGADDLLSPQEHSERMYEALLAAGNHRARLEIVEGMGHFFEIGSERFGFDLVTRIVLNWLAETLSS